MPSLQKRARFIVLTTFTLVVLAVVPTLNDSSSLPKYSILFVSAALGISVLGIPKFGLLEKKHWKTWAPPVLFISTMLVMALLTDQKYVAFLGNYAGNQGWLQYLSLATLFLLTAFSFNFETLRRFFNVFTALGVIVASYGFLQYKGIDFFDYTDLTAPAISTLGNSNFASAFMGLAAISLLWKITDVKPALFKMLLIIILFGQIYVIYISQSSQGYFVLLIGASIFIGIKFFTSTKRIGAIYFSLLGAVLFFGLLGLLQIGPLTKFVYQSSTTFRGDYFRAAWQMFISHPLTGVGIDRFGANYREFRDVEAALRAGPTVVANYAHNTLLQFLATGGFFLFLAYLVMIFFVAAAALQGLRKFRGNDKALFGALVGLWSGFLIQQQVSIDQLSLAATGWVLAGAVVALGFNSEIISEREFPPNRFAKKLRVSMFNSTMVAGSLTIVLLVTSFSWLVPTWRADSNIKVAQILQGDLRDYNFLSEKRRLAQIAVSNAPGEITYKILASKVMFSIGDLGLARQYVKGARNQDVKSYDSVWYAAQAYEYENLLNQAIKLRIVATKMDPNDTTNWLQLGKNLARVGDYQAVKKVIELVAPLAGKSTIADDLKALLPAVRIS
jgi:O-antigen ligase